MMEIDNLDILFDLFDAGDIEDQFDRLKNFGFDLNLSIIKRDHRDYAVGVNVRCSTDGKEDINIRSYEENDEITLAIEHIVTDLNAQIKEQTQNDKDIINSLREEKTSLEAKMASLETDKALLEHRVSELAEALRMERAKERMGKYDNLLDAWTSICRSR